MAIKLEKEPEEFSLGQITHKIKRESTIDSSIQEVPFLSDAEETIVQVNGRKYHLSSSDISGATIYANNQMLGYDPPPTVSSWVEDLLGGPDPYSKETDEERDEDLSEDKIPFRGRPKKSLSDYKSPYNGIGIPILEKMSVASKVSLFFKTKNKSFIYRVLLLDYAHILERARSSEHFLDEYHERYIFEDLEHISHQLDRDIKFTSKKIDVTEIITIAKDLITGLYAYISGTKDVYLTIEDRGILINILKTCKEKGIIIDDVISKLRDTDFSISFNTRIRVNLLYVPSINYILYESYNLNADYSGIRTFDTITAALPTVEKLEGEDTIKINDIPYNKKSFESLVETNFDKFIQNLEIDSLLDKKDTDAVDLSNLL